MSDDVRCQNCGNRARLNVVVDNDAFGGRWCRLACSRVCADILAQAGQHEINAQLPGYNPGNRVTVSPILTHAS